MFNFIDSGLDTVSVANLRTFPILSVDEVGL